MLAASDFQELPGNHLYSVIKATQTYVALDTGATETAAGLQQADDLIRALREFDEIWVEVSRDQLPWFKFGDGKWLQAVSRLLIQKKTSSQYLEKLTLYTLDAECPVLIGSKTLKDWEAKICYKTDTLEVLGKPYKLLVTPNGHRLFDLSQI